MDEWVVNFKYTQKQPGSKNGVALFKMASIKSCEIKRGAQEMAVMVKILIITTWVNLC